MSTRSVLGNLLPPMIFALCAVTAQAAELRSQISAQAPEEMIVCADREDEKPVAIVRRIDAVEIENRGARTLDEALDLLPGLGIYTGGKGVPRIEMRGLRSRQLLLLIDGVPLNSAFDGQFDPGIVPVENIAEIRVAYGNSSVLYGPGAVGGVIDIITRSGGEGVRGSVQQEFGENVDFHGRYSVSGGGEKYDFLVSATVQETDGFELADDFDPTTYEDGGLRENSDATRRTLYAKAGCSPNDRLRLGLAFNRFEGDYGRPPRIFDQSDPFSSKVVYERMDDYEGTTAQISAEYDMPGPFSFESRVYANRIEETLVAYAADTSSARGEMKVRGLDTRIAYHHERFGDVTAGLLAKKELWEDDGSGDEIGNPTYTAALEYEKTVVAGLDAVAGAGRHWFEKDSGGDVADWSWQAGLRYELDGRTTLSGSAARKVRFPTIKDLYDRKIGNAALEAENSRNFELGIARRLPFGACVGITGFVNDVKNFIQKDVFTEVNENRDHYLFRGVETTVEMRPGGGWFARVAYTYTDSEDRSPGSDYDEIQYTPRDKLTIEGGYRFDRGLMLNASLRHVDRQYHYSRKAPTEKRELGSYTVANIRVSQTLCGDRAKLYVGVDNLFDANYSTAYAYPQAGRFVYGGLKFGV